VPSYQRDGLVQHLKAEQIGCEIYYPLCLHQQECLGYLGDKTGDFPHSEAAAASVIALPMFPEITEAQQRTVVEACAVYQRHSLRKAA
jgi:dTDP-4-amino-4,6-dideoxygalactose transaminase